MKGVIFLQSLRPHIHTSGLSSPFSSRTKHFQFQGSITLWPHNARIPLGLESSRRRFQGNF